MNFAVGNCITTSRLDVHYIVTEYGIANLRGKSVEDRAKMLIGIAHPAFREQLAREACTVGLLRNHEFATSTK
jgi:4-hydroxybutyrate CoA-transferase